MSVIYYKKELMNEQRHHLSLLAYSRIVVLLYCKHTEIIANGEWQNTQQFAHGQVHSGYHWHWGVLTYHSEIKENIVSLWTYNIKLHFYENCKSSKGLIQYLRCSIHRVWFGFFFFFWSLWLCIWANRCKLLLLCSHSIWDINYKRGKPSNYTAYICEVIG